MNHIIRNVLASTSMVLLLTASGATAAFASQVTGTLTGGTGSGSTVTGVLSGSTGTGSTVSGTVTGGITGSVGTISGTVTGGSSNSSSSGGGGGFSGGSSGSGSPQGQVLGASTGPVAISTTSYDPSAPGAPNTGEGGNSPMNYLLLTLSGLIAIAGTLVLSFRKRML